MPSIGPHVRGKVVTISVLALTLAWGCGGGGGALPFGGSNPSSNPSTSGALPFTGTSSTSTSSGEPNASSSSSSGLGGSSSGAMTIDPGMFAQCATAEAETQRGPVYMLMVLDGSGSMNDAPREIDPRDTAVTRGAKWIAVRDALIAFYERLGAAPDPSIAVGLYLFSSTAAKPPLNEDVPIRFVNPDHATLLSGRLLPPIAPSGGTPLLTSIQGQLPILTSFVPSAPVDPNGKYVLVVITDGVPDGGQYARNSCISAAQAAFSPPAGRPAVTTFAVGVGDPQSGGYDEMFMGKLAKAGGAAPFGCDPDWNESSPATAVPCHFQITPGAKTAAQIGEEFGTAVDAIKTAAASCDFVLQRGSAEIDPGLINVVHTPAVGDPVAFTKDASNGWTYDDPALPTKVLLHGSACDRVKRQGGQVKIVIGCSSVVTR